MCLHTAGLLVFSWLFGFMALFELLISIMIVQEKYLLI